MKKSYLLYAMGATLAFSACSSEENMPDNNGVLEEGKSFYVNVAITTDNEMGTRANSEGYNGTGNPDFEKGETAESVVNNVYFVFYDANGVVVGEPVFVPVSDMDVTADADGVNVLRSYTSIVKVDVNRGEGKPAQVMCYINPVSTAELANSIQNVETVARDKFQDNDGGFSMSNSVYYNGASEASTLVRAVEISGGKLFESEQAAKDAIAEAAKEDENGDDTAARVVIYVERYASKVKMQFAEEDVVTPYVPANSAVTLTFVPEKWDVNATDKQTFVTKAFRSNAGLGSPAGADMTFGQVNTELGRTDWTWNSVINNRSYWGFSPAYYSTTYPGIAYDVIQNEDNFKQNYLSFDDIVADGLTPSNTTTYRYTTESTVSKAGLGSSNPAAAIASAVLVGHYQVRLNNVLVQNADGTDLTFYSMGANSDGKANVYFGASLNTTEAGSVIASEVTGAPTMIEAFADKETILLVGHTVNGTTTYEPLTKANLVHVFNALTIARPSEAVYGKLGEHSASRTVTLQINDLSRVDVGYSIAINVGEGAQTIYTGEETAVPAGQVALVDANAALARAAGWANRYNEGRAFFNMPIRHLGWYAGTNPNADATTIDYSKVRVGDFGLVRNHVYNLNINSITGLGTGVSEPDEPIVPPVETKDYFVAYSLRILNWAIVPVQDIDL